MKGSRLLGLILGGAIGTVASTARAENFPLFPVPEPPAHEQPNQRQVIVPTPPAAPLTAHAQQPQLPREPATIETGIGYSLGVRDADKRTLILHQLPFTLSYRFNNGLTGAVDGSVDIVRKNEDENNGGYETVRVGPRLDFNSERLDGRVFAYFGVDDLQFERNDREAFAVDAGADLSANVAGSLDLFAAVRERYAFPGSVFSLRAGPRYALSGRFAVSLGASHVREGPYDNKLTSGFAGLTYGDPAGLRFTLEGMGGQRSGARGRLQVPLGRPDVVLDLAAEGYADRDDTKVNRGGGMASVVFGI